jgi:hypothetical protein
MLLERYGDSGYRPPVFGQTRQNDASAVDLIEKNRSGLIGYAGVALVLAVIIIKVLL